MHVSMYIGIVFYTQQILQIWNSFMTIVKPLWRLFQAEVRAKWPSLPALPRLTGPDGMPLQSKI